jgi:hypothetical protein
MVTFYRGRKWKIAVYGREHGIPHFHLEGPEFRCSVSIASGDVIIGSAPPQVLAAARAWARKNRAGLMRGWRELNP